MLSHMQASYGRPLTMTNFDRRLRKRKRRLVNHTRTQNNLSRTTITHIAHRESSDEARNGAHGKIITRRKPRSHVSLTKSINIVRRTPSVSIVAIQATLVEIAPTRSI